MSRFESITARWCSSISERCGISSYRCAQQNPLHRVKSRVGGQRIVHTK